MVDDYFKDSADDSFKDSADDSWIKGGSISAEAGAYVLSGSDVVLGTSGVIVCDSGVYSLSGTDVALIFSQSILAESGLYNLVGLDVALSFSFATGWFTERNRGPWNFTEQSEKWGYLNNPRWTKEETINHLPCGHWHKRPRPSSHKVIVTPVTTGQWVAATQQRGTPYVYYYDIGLYAIIKVDVSFSNPTIVDILVINDSAYFLEYQIDGGNNGSYAMSEDFNKIWYLFRNNSNQSRVVTVDISGSTMSHTSTNLPSLSIANNTVICGAADDDYSFFSIKYSAGDQGRIVIIKSDHTYTDNIVSTPNTRGSIIGIVVNTNLKQIRYMYDADSTIGIVIPRATYDLSIIDTYYQGYTFVPNYPGTLLYYNSTLDIVSFANNSFVNGRVFDGWGMTDGYNEFDHTIGKSYLGMDSSYLYFSWINITATVNYLSRYTLDGSFDSSILSRISIAVDPYLAYGNDHNAIFNEYTRKSIYARYSTPDGNNLLATFDTNLTLINDTLLSDKYTSVDYYAFPDQKTDNEPQVWALPGETYDQNNNI